MILDYSTNLHGLEIWESNGMFLHRGQHHKFHSLQKNTFLVIQFKGLAMAALVFPIKNAALAATPTEILAQAPLGPASYGFVFLTEDTIVTTDGQNGIVLYQLTSNGSLASGNTIQPSGARAYCWMAYSWLTRRPYAIAAGTANVTEITVDANNKLGWGASPYFEADAPLTDGFVIPAVGTDWLYVISKNGISIWPITGKDAVTYTTTVSFPAGATTVGGLTGFVFDTSGALTTKSTLFIFVLAILSVFVNLM